MGEPSHVFCKHEAHMAEWVLFIEDHLIWDLGVEPLSILCVSQLVVCPDNECCRNVEVFEGDLGWFEIAILLKISSGTIVVQSPAIVDDVLQVEEKPLIARTTWEVFDENIQSVEVVD